ncbi:MAG: MarR family transcriptional regulator [Actinomycetota bacterium]|nr:MarR family transcriptional regulator [Actinomycetota bacterium]
METVLPRWQDDDGVAAWAAFLRAYAAVVPSIDAELRRGSGLPLTWYDVLLELSAAPGQRLRMQDLGQRAVISRTRASRVVDELVTAGYVSREANPDDKRSSFATLTVEGRRVFRRAAPRYLDAVRRQFADPLSPEQLRFLRDALEQLLDSSAQ